MQKGQHHTEEAKQSLREARQRQVHPSLAARGITIDQVDEARRNGLRWCSGQCRAFVKCDLFTGASQRCRECVKLKRRKWRERASPERLASEAIKIWEWRQENPDYDRRFRLLLKYGVTPEWYDKTLEAQGGHCALCSATSAHVNRKTILFVDHCHSSGAVRGLLCAKCNTHLGIVEADPTWHERALEYLTKPRC
jgi:hypothetical protein